MIVYTVGPIDFWAGFMTEEQFAQYVTPGRREDAFQASNVGDFFHMMMDGARKLGWEGDIREGPFYAPLPPHDMGELPGLLVAFKQDNNGQTFIGSSYRLPYLEDGQNWLEFYDI